MNFADHEDLAERQKRRHRRQRSDMVWNFLTGIVLLATVGLIGAMMLLFSNPHIALNPFPPPTMPVLVVLPSSTPTLVVMPSTWTPTPPPIQTPKPIQMTSTPEPTFNLPTSAPPTPIVTDENAAYPFALKSQPIAMSNTVFRPDSDCNWQGVAGRVEDLQGRPVVGMLVRLTGFYNGKTIALTTLTGGAQAWYGESGYEFLLGQKPIDSTGSLSIQLTDQGLLPISDRVIFNTYAACDKNLILINFKQVR
jgi:hypothetical protein